MEEYISDEEYYFHCDEESEIDNDNENENENKYIDNIYFIKNYCKMKQLKIFTHPNTEIIMMNKIKKLLCK